VHGRIPAGAWVLLRTGWSSRTDAPSFLNVRADGPHTPGFHADASRFLAIERDVLGVGVETVGTMPDRQADSIRRFQTTTSCTAPASSGWPSLRNLDQLPAIGAIVIAAPLKIVNGSGSPLRVLAIAPA
jgi:kynurenine formamidase